MNSDYNNLKKEQLILLQILNTTTDEGLKNVIFNRIKNNVDKMLNIINESDNRERFKKENDSSNETNS